MTIELIRGNGVLSPLATKVFPTLTFDPHRWYRMELTVQGATGTGYLYDCANLQTPLGKINANLPNDPYKHGFVGMFNIDQAPNKARLTNNNGFQVSWDNFTATSELAPPSLSIQPPVTLSWPGHTVGWILQSANTVEGPWTNRHATPTLADGLNIVTLPSSAASQYLRLVKP